jgi:hypothetical protein
MGCLNSFHHGRAVPCFTSPKQEQMKNTCSKTFRCLCSGHKYTINKEGKKFRFKKKRRKEVESRELEIEIEIEN